MIHRNAGSTIQVSDRVSVVRTFFDGGRYSRKLLLKSFNFIVGTVLKVRDMFGREVGCGHQHFVDISKLTKRSDDELTQTIDSVEGSCND